MNRIAAVISEHRKRELVNGSIENVPGHFIIKPFLRRRLESVLKRMLGGTAGEDPGRKPAEAAAIPSIDGGRILLVEDDSINRQVTGKLLEKAGIEVVSAENGVEALAAVNIDPQRRPETLSISEFSKLSTHIMSD